jgi:ribosomal RNA assembly protein
MNSKKMEFHEETTIPKARVAVLIGAKGATRKAIERKSHTKIKISADGVVTINGNNALELMTVKNIIEAVGRGFNPELALELLKEENAYELINIEDYIGKNKALERIRGVMIGKEGKTRKLIEKLTGVHLSIYGKTVAIIGSAEKVTIAHQAIEMFLTGAKHSTVYRFLERKTKKTIKPEEATK